MGTRVQMPDGVSLGCDIYRPSGAGSWPTILVRTPYDRSTAASRSLQIDAIAFAEAGYAVVVQDVRGRYDSGGDFTPFVDEQDDGVETIEWLVGQRWCNGRVGMAGISYLGFCQLAAAAAMPEPLMAIAPGLTVADARDGWFTAGRVFNAGFNLAWMLGALLPADPRTTNLEAVLAAFDDPLSTAVSESLASSGPLSGAWTEWQQKDPYHGCRSVPGLNEIAGISIPSLVIAGWFDIFQPATFDLFEALPAASLVAGPWGHVGLPLGRRIGERDHGREASLDMRRLHRQFFDRHLRGDGAALDPVAVFVTGVDRWETMEQWPPCGHPMSMFVGSTDHMDIRVDPADPTPCVGGRSFGWDPTVVPGCFDQTDRERRADVASFTTDPLDEALFVVGPVALVVEIGGHVGTVFVMVCDVDLEGRSWNVADGVAIALSGSTTVRLGHMAHVFKPGHRLRVSVSFGAYPRYRWDPPEGVWSVGVSRLDVSIFA